MQLSGKPTNIFYLAKYQHRPNSSGLCRHLSKTHNTGGISLTNQYHHFGSFSSLTSPCACSFLISLSMGELICEDGIISSSRYSDMPCSLPSPHFWHMNKKYSLFVFLHCGISLKEYATQGSHETAGIQVGARSRLVAIAYSSQMP